MRVTIDCSESSNVISGGDSLVFSGVLPPAGPRRVIGRLLVEDRLQGWGYSYSVSADSE